MSMDLKEDILRAVADSRRLSPDLVPPTSVSQGGLYGWICPKCGAVMSPFQNFCIKCGGNLELTWTAKGTGANYTIPTNSECNTNIDTYRCHKCVHEPRCFCNLDTEGKCPDYKRDAPDGGYYG